MVNNAAQHETGAKTFLGTTIPAGTDGPHSLRLALDAIFAHPNVPPFVSQAADPASRHLQSRRRPMSARISAVFANNGSGVRGDLRAVVRAILLDVEARSDAIAGAPTYGKLREPIMRLTGWARAFNATSPSGAWPIGDTSSTANRLGQSPGRSPSVFNFFRPGYTPPNSAIATAGLVAPEFQITNEPSVIAYVNYMAALIVDRRRRFPRQLYRHGRARRQQHRAGRRGRHPARRGAQRRAPRPASAPRSTRSRSARPTRPQNRVYTAILLTLASPEYLVQK